nr:hypothetical protein Iba_chr03aCG6830 [Ipomoea batatas]GMD02974.1 hypothetical protein Iba_scaffold970574CG0010 [Ipomoea batatas]GMD67944.1 hypothetical protein Iba_scaffold264659CG0010 [Ipomoea batatas]
MEAGTHWIFGQKQSRDLVFFKHKLCCPVSLLLSIRTWLSQKHGMLFRIYQQAFPTSMVPYVFNNFPVSNYSIFYGW